MTLRKKIIIVISLSVSLFGGYALGYTTRDHPPACAEQCR